MPPQHIEIAETIAALKRALRREKEAPSDQPIYSATNRGNKLKRGASYVHAGALPYPHGSEGYKQKVEHAGFTRYILARNPRRYNEYGDELEESESDAEADADAEDENPYSAVRLEELLCPLKHPAELAIHPTLSLPFLDPALPDMVVTTEAKLRQERANLWRAKNLNRQFIGDEAWMPCESVESVDDWDLFEPAPKAAGDQSRKRKRNDERPTQNGANSQGHNSLVDDENESAATAEAGLEDETIQKAAVDVSDPSKPVPSDAAAQPSAADDVHMDDADQVTNGVRIKKDPHEADGEADEGLPAVNGVGSNVDADAATGEEQTENAAEEDGSDEATPPPPPRRITRALAAETQPSSTSTPPLSPTTTISSISSSLLTVDPIFLLPSSLQTSDRMPEISSQLGLSAEELLDTRRLLIMYIQKQEESVRGYEAVLGKLIKAKRLRDTLWDWCKTEGHVGEWSDGEDWIDAEAWGVGPGELKKGKDEEEVEGVEEVGRKGKRRRNRE